MGNALIKHSSSVAEQSKELVAALKAVGVRNAEKAEAVIEAGAKKGVRPIRALLNAGYEWRDIERAGWAHKGFEVIDVHLDDIDIDLLKKFPLTSAKRLAALPVKSSDDQIRVVLSDPTHMLTIDDIREHLGPEIDFVVSDKETILAIVEQLETKERHFNASDFVDERDESSAEAKDEAEALDSDSDSKIATFIKSLIDEAAAANASDIHLEPTDSDFVARFRIDGVLHEIERLPFGIAAPAINRVKVLANMDVGERRVPQDGRIGVKVAGRDLDIRVVTVPTSWGVESAVMRLLDQTKEVTDLETLGYSEHVLKVYHSLIKHTQGCLLATGPTGSGKTTTLYATLKMIATPERKVLTVEDPVEYKFPGITQVQVNKKAGLTFASALRSFLRADPDVILVGELRDEETANTGIQAALTGHLVLATVHANSAAGVPVRLVEMGVEPFLVASSLKGVISQRLIRKLCDSCKDPYPVPDQYRDGLPWPEEPPEFLFKGREDGCGRCNRTGYKGRAAIAEVLTTSDEIGVALSRNATTQEIEEIATELGMITIFQDGLLHAAAGNTSLEELSRVVG